MKQQRDLFSIRISDRAEAVHEDLGPGIPHRAVAMFASAADANLFILAASGQLQSVPKPSITIASSLTMNELADSVRHEYKDQELTPAMAELLRRVDV